MRAPNAIDFWRGLALVMIFINHVPGTIYSNLTLHPYSISDAAEMFVFLAGCSLLFVVGPPGARKAPGQVVSKLLKRAFKLWWSQLLILWLAVFMIGSAAIAFQATDLFYWHNAGPAFYDTSNALLGSLMLTYQIGYFNILPLYVALLLIASVPLLVARHSRLAAFGLSLALYVVALANQFNLINWPGRGVWHFNPLTWQFLLVIGYLSADLAAESRAFRQAIERAWPVAVALVLAGALATIYKIWPNHMLFPEPRLFFMLDKSWLSPMRIVSMLALAVAFYGAFARLRPHIPAAADFLTALGRNSLPVFCVLSLAALAGQITRHLAGGYFLLDTAIILAGLVLMRAAAWVSEDQGAKDIVRGLVLRTARSASDR